MNNDVVDPDSGGGTDLLVRGKEALALEPGSKQVTVLPPRLRKRRRSQGDVHVKADTPLKEEPDKPPGGQAGEWGLPME